MVLRGVPTHDQHHVGVLDVDITIGHRSASECGPQTGDRGAVSNTGLGFYITDPQAAHGLAYEVIEFVGIGAATDPGDAFAAVHGTPDGIPLDERFVAGLFHPVADLGYGLVPRDVFPVIGARPAHLRLKEPPWVKDVLFQ